MLGLETEPSATQVGNPAFSLDGAVQEIPRVELQTRLIGKDVQRAATGGIDYPRRVMRLGPRATIEHEVVVVAAGDLELSVGGVDPRADGGRSPEIEGRSRHRREDTGGNQGGVDRSVAGRIDGEHVSQNVG